MLRRKQAAEILKPQIQVDSRRTQTGKNTESQEGQLVAISQAGTSSTELQPERYIFQGGRCNRDQLHDARDRESIILSCFSFEDFTDCNVLKMGKAGEGEREVNNANVVFNKFGNDTTTIFGLT